MSTITRGKGKRFQNKKEIDKLNRIALYIGGTAAALILILMLVSFFIA
jgi:hypothetical protein